MLSIGSRLHEVIASERLQLAYGNLLTPCFNCFIHVKNQLREKSVTSLILSLFDNVITLTLLSFPLYYLSTGRLREIKSKRKSQTFTSKSGRCRFREE